MSTHNDNEGLGEIILAVAVGYIIYKVGQTIIKRLTDSGEEIVVGYEGGETKNKNLPKSVGDSSKNTSNCDYSNDDDDEDDSSDTRDDYYYYYDIYD